VSRFVAFLGIGLVLCCSGCKKGVEA
jgi:hypothetical protein